MLALRERGQGIVEYGLILALAALVVLLILNVLDEPLSVVVNFIVDAVEAAT